MLRFPPDIASVLAQMKLAIRSGSTWLGDTEHAWWLFDSHNLFDKETISALCIVDRDFELVGIQGGLAIRFEKTDHERSLFKALGDSTLSELDAVYHEVNDCETRQLIRQKIYALKNPLKDL